MATEAQRKHLKALMKWLVSKESLVHYRQARPMATIHWIEQPLADHFEKGLTISSDCSEMVTLLCKLSGLQDPNGRGYDGYGNTDSILSHLPHYSDPSAAQVGALCVYGPQGRSHHVVMVYEPGKDPLCFSHGTESDPRFVRWSVEKAYQPAPATFCSIRHL